MICLAAVPLAGQAEVGFGLRVAPLDAVSVVENDYAFGQGRAGLLEALQRSRQPHLDLGLAAQRARQ